MSFMEEIIRSNYARQLDIIRPDEIPEISIIGCGASGSAIGIICAKLGVNRIKVYDGDTVEKHNIPNQWFGGTTLNENKAIALKEEIERYIPVEMEMSSYIEAFDKMFDEEDADITTPIVFMCVDGLMNRRKIFNMLEDNDNVEWVIDTRMGAEMFEVRTIDMRSEVDKAKWLDSLVMDEVDAPCTGRSIIYTIMVMTGIAVNFFKRIVREQPVPIVHSQNLEIPSMPIYREWREGEDGF